jgi:hypothetical protein
VERGGKILRLGDGSDYIAIESLTVQPLVLVQAPPSVSPLVICQSISVPN